MKFKGFIKDFVALSYYICTSLARDMLNYERERKLRIGDIVVVSSKTDSERHKVGVYIGSYQRGPSQEAGDVESKFRNRFVVVAANGRVRKFSMSYWRVRRVFE